MEEMERKLTSMQITQEFKNWLETQGSKGESFEDIVRRLVSYRKDQSTK